VTKAIISKLRVWEHGSCLRTKAMPKEMMTLVDRPLIQLPRSRGARGRDQRSSSCHGARQKRARGFNFDRQPELERFVEEAGRHERLETSALHLHASGRDCVHRQHRARWPLASGLVRRRPVNRRRTVAVDSCLMNVMRGRPRPACSRWSEALPESAANGRSDGGAARQVSALTAAGYACERRALWCGCARWFEKPKVEDAPSQSGGDLRRNIRLPQGLRKR